MPFLNIPLKTISVEITDIQGVETMPWYDPVAFPVLPGQPYPEPIAKDFRWRITLDVSLQQQSSYLTRSPGIYNGQDITVGQWIANNSTGQSWQIISIESKSSTQVIAIVQDIYRYNTFRDPIKLGNGSPTFGLYIVFSLSDAGLPQIDPIPESGVSSTFTQNLQSRFEYINVQYDYPLYQNDNNFAINDVVTADASINSFVLASATSKLVIGRITSISDTIPGWFTINPVQKIVDNLNYLPGDVGDIIYSSTTEPGGITIVPGGSQLYIKLKNNTSSISYNTLPGPTSAGNIFQLNGIDITVGGTGTIADIVTAVNPELATTGVEAAEVLAPTVAQTNQSLISSTYGEVVMFAATSPATATINGVSVTFNLLSTTPGYEDYTQATQMATVINSANIPNITAAAPNPQLLVITDVTGAAITIVNTQADINGVSFAGSNSGSGIQLNTAASTEYKLKFTAVDARPIDFLDVVGATVADFGLISVENGAKACGLYIEEGLRQVISTVVADLTQLNALNPLIGDQAYVIDSNDGQGNNVGEWSMWLYDGVIWVETGNQDSATTDAKSLEYTVTTGSPALINIGAISTGRRITLITVEVTEPFNTPATLDIGYQVNNPSPPPPVIDGLMPAGIIDLTVTGTYTTQTDILFGTDTVQGDVEITASFGLAGATVGSAQIIVSYV